MSTATSKVIPVGSDGASPSQGPSPIEFRGPFAHVPPLEEIERLTEVPDRRVVFRGVDWDFYDRLVDSIPESSNIKVDYDGRDLEVMGKGSDHELAKRLLGRIVDVVAEEFDISFAGYAEMTWKRPELSRGIEADETFYFQAEKLAAAAKARTRKPRNVAHFPNPDLAIEVDISRPEIDRAGIYAALSVAEVWRFNGRIVIIERLTADGKYRATKTSGFLPISAEDIHRWLTDKDVDNQVVWLRKLRTEIKARVAKKTKQRRKK